MEDLKIIGEVEDIAAALEFLIKDKYMAIRFFR